MNDWKEGLGRNIWLIRWYYFDDGYYGSRFLFDFVELCVIKYRFYYILIKVGKVCEVVKGNLK